MSMRNAPQNRQPRWLDDERGMNLVELMMALVVMSVGIMGIATLFPFGTMKSVDDRNLTTAVDLAQQQMEQIRMLSYSDGDLNPGWHPSAAGDSVGPSNRFIRRYQVTQLTGDMSDMKSVEVQVTWPSARPDTVRLVTYILR